MTLKKSAAVAVALLLSLAVVGCGSKKDDSASNTESGGQAEKQSQPNPEASTTTTGSDGSTSTTSDLSNGLNSLNDITGGQLGDCLGTSLAYASLVLAPLGFTGGATQEQIDKFEKDTQDLEAKIPPELKDDFDTVAAAYKAYGDALKGIDFSDLFNSDTQQKLQDASDKLDAPEVKAAQDHIQAYFDSNCGN
ncbi:MAG: hypothetical protein ACXWBN_19675 [Acidimicrobiales bacterium]